MADQLQPIPKSYATPSQSAANVPSTFVDGVDLDPIFLEESWTLGVSAAVASQHRRQQLKSDREHQARASRALDHVGTASFLKHRQVAAEAALTDRAATIVDRYDPTASKSWAPQDWVPQDQIAQRWIPQGWAPNYMPRFEGPQQAARCTESGDRTMTPQRARLLLEVTPASSREKVRSAYRRMVGQWHPDRLQFTTEAIRIHATQHMAALNEAYRLLCAMELEQAA